MLLARTARAQRDGWVASLVAGVRDSRLVWSTGRGGVGDGHDRLGSITKTVTAVAENHRSVGATTDG